MVRYKMLGRDINASPAQYRTWIVEDEPDFTGQLYSGLKSGLDPLVDINAYIIYDNTVIADFNLPNPLHWDTTRKVLPSPIADSQLAIIDGYAYLFGGKISPNIYRADINKPTDWVDTGSALPSALYGSQLAIVDGYVYLFGGNDGSTTDHIYSAPISDPLTWTDNGSKLPYKIQNSQIVIVDDNLYLLGGRNVTNAVSDIYSASISDPLTWVDTGKKLPNSLCNSQVAVIDGYAYLFGGLGAVNSSSNYIYSASLDDLTTWNIANVLPYAVYNSQFFTIGNNGYLITPGSPPNLPKSKGTRILRCDLSSPTQWIDTQKFIPGEVSQSQIAIIYDRIFLFGGNGSNIIFANASELKYKFGIPSVVSYGTVTREEYNNTPNKLDLFRVLGFPYWKTSYGA